MRDRFDLFIVSVLVLFLEVAAIRWFPAHVLFLTFFTNTVLLALTMLGPGQALGRSLARVPNRIEAYTVNIAGSVAGVLLFTACSLWQLGPMWWFGLVVVGLLYVLMPHDPLRAAALAVGPAA